MERYRTAIVVVAALAGVALISRLRLLLGLAARLRLLDHLDARPDRRRPRPGATPALGYVQPDMGHQHVGVGDKVTYTYCAPASGNAHQQAGRRRTDPGPRLRPERQRHPAGLDPQPRARRPGRPLPGRQHRRDAPRARPSCARSTTPSRQARSAARPRARSGRSSPGSTRCRRRSRRSSGVACCQLDTFDQAKILAFWEQWGERTNPEKQCAVPSASPTTSEAPAESGAPSATPAVTASPLPSAERGPGQRRPVGQLTGRRCGSSRTWAMRTAGRRSSSVTASSRSSTAS